jgi:predicted HD phosphohydrolase
MDNYGVKGHENKGYDYLKKLGFNDRICNLVKNHVSAKRYLCSVDIKYYENLSDASKATMKYQGGIMDEDEIDKFKNNIYFDDSLKIRYLDDMGKQIM